MADARVQANVNGEATPGKAELLALGKWPSKFCGETEQSRLALIKQMVWHEKRGLTQGKVGLLSFNQYLSKRG